MVHSLAEAFLGEIIGFSRRTSWSRVFQWVFICIVASVNWASYGIALSD